MAATKDQLFRRELVARIGTLIYGERWIAPMAFDLSRVTGRAIGGPQVSHWISGTRPYPAWVENAVLRVMQARIAEILDEGKKLRAEVLSLESHLASQLGPEPEPEPDNAPAPGMM